MSLFSGKVLVFFKKKLLGNLIMFNKLMNRKSWSAKEATIIDSRVRDAAFMLPPNPKHRQIISCRKRTNALYIYQGKISHLFLFF